VNSSHHVGPASTPPQSRRRFLRTTFLGTIALSVGKGLSFGSPRGASREAETGGRLLFFDDEEFALFAAIADRIVGPRPEDAPPPAEIARRADVFLAGADPEIREQFHLLLTIMDSAVVAFLFDLRLSSFRHLDPDAQDAFLSDWMTSPLAFRRTAFQALKRVSMSTYYSHPGSWNAIAFDGSYEAA
jgi:hypothetical protein